MWRSASRRSWTFSNSTRLSVLMTSLGVRVGVRAHERRDAGLHHHHDETGGQAVARCVADRDPAAVVDRRARRSSRRRPRSRSSSAPRSRGPSTARLRGRIDVWMRAAISSSRASRSLSASCGARLVDLLRHPVHRGAERADLGRVPRSACGARSPCAIACVRATSASIGRDSRRARPSARISVASAAPPSSMNRIRTIWRAGRERLVDRAQQQVLDRVRRRDSRAPRRAARTSACRRARPRVRPARTASSAGPSSPALMPGGSDVSARAIVDDDERATGVPRDRVARTSSSIA